MIWCQGHALRSAFATRPRCRVLIQILDNGNRSIESYEKMLISRGSQVSSHVLSGWPSGLRRQTQELFLHIVWVFWSPNGGVGSNPTSDNQFTYLA